MSVTETRISVKFECDCAKCQAADAPTTAKETFYGDDLEEAVKRAENMGWRVNKARTSAIGPACEAPVG